MRRYRGRRRSKADKLQAYGALVIALACMSASGLFEDYSLTVAAAVLTSMVLAGGYLIWLSNH